MASQSDKDALIHEMTVLSTRIFSVLARASEARPSLVPDAPLGSYVAG